MLAILDRKTGFEYWYLFVYAPYCKSNKKIHLVAYYNK